MSGSTATLKGNLIMDRKIVSISSKRQITIPQKFFEALQFDNEAECVVRGNELVIRSQSISLRNSLQTVCPAMSC